MKKSFILFVVAMVATLSVWAQVPQTLTYQAVVRDGNGRLICNSNVGVRISILQGSESGVAVYSDQQTVRTNANGLFTLLIGTAENSISGIDWAAGPYFLKSEIDHAGGTNYTLTTVQQMFSVPYALRAHTADSVIGGVSTNEVDPVFSAWDKDYNDLINRPDFTETQTLSDVATLGNNVGTQIKQLSDPTEQLDAVNLRTLNIIVNTVVTNLSNRIDSITHRYDSIMYCFDSIIHYQDSVIDTLTSLVTEHGSTTNTPLNGFDSNGASVSLFSVAADRQVRFSRGNLQYTTTGTHEVYGGDTEIGIWRFAEHQYDTIGSANSSISSSYTGWIDLFAWGTSGWNSGAVSYMPWDSRNAAGDNHINSLTDAYARADWGVYNAISNGGNQPGMWRTLTKDEWNYLINTRNASPVGYSANARYAQAMVLGTKGVIIFPDIFTLPTGLDVTNINSSSADFTVNNYTLEQWTQLEAAGCIFLPCAGQRWGITVSGVGGSGYYWSSTSINEYYATDIWISPGGGGIYEAHNFHCVGESVRLVRDSD